MSESFAGPTGGRSALELDRADGGRPSVRVVASAGDVATVAAALIEETVAAAVAARGVAHVALTGGSTAGGVYRALSERGPLHAVPWHRAHLWWGDERYVPREDQLANAWIADTELLGGHHGRGIHVPRAQVHPVPTDELLAAGGDAAACAARYGDELARAGLPTDADGWPVFDLVLLGLGSDGHLLSVFPESAAFDAPAWAVGVPAPTHIAPHVARVTLNPAIVPAARAILATATGEGKATILAELFSAARDPRRLPAQLARRATATWVLDEDAARLLPAEVTTR